MKRITRILSLITPLLLTLASAPDALAYYDPGMQRWINRDPLGERGGRNAYRTNRNNPITRIDALGLCPKSCEQVCAEFNQLPNAGALGCGGLICNGSEKCPCYTPGPNDPPPGECPAFEKIVLDHERSHIPDVDCPGSNLGNKFPDFPKWKPGTDGTFAECYARVQSLNDLREAIPDASGRCKEAMQRSEQEMFEWVMSNCD